MENMRKLFIVKGLRYRAGKDKRGIEFQGGFGRGKGDGQATALEQLGVAQDGRYWVVGSWVCSAKLL